MTNKGSLFLSLTWIVISLLWFLRMDSPIVGFVWLVAGIFELVITMIGRKEERKNISEPAPIGSAESTAFSLHEKADYYKKRWLKEHLAIILLLGFLLFVWFITGLVLKQSLMMSVTPGLVAVAHAWRNNSMMAYTEDHICGKAGTKDTD